MAAEHSKDYLSRTQPNTHALQAGHRKKIKHSDVWALALCQSE